MWTLNLVLGEEDAASGPNLNSRNPFLHLRSNRKFHSEWNSLFKKKTPYFQCNRHCRASAAICCQVEKPDVKVVQRWRSESWPTEWVGRLISGHFDYHFKNCVRVHRLKSSVLYHFTDPRYQHGLRSARILRLSIGVNYLTVTITWTLRLNKLLREIKTSDFINKLSNHKASKGWSTCWP